MKHRENFVQCKWINYCLFLLQGQLHALTSPGKPPPTHKNSLSYTHVQANAVPHWSNASMYKNMHHCNSLPTQQCISWERVLVAHIVLACHVHLWTLGHTHTHKHTMSRILKKDTFTLSLSTHARGKQFTVGEEEVQGWIGLSVNTAERKQNIRCCDKMILQCWFITILLGQNTK